MTRPPSLSAAVRDAERRLRDAGVASPRADAERLAAHVLRSGPGEVAAAVVLGRILDDAEAARYEELVAHRAARVPLQHLTGRAPFRTIELEVGPGVFVPRPETETVAGLAIDAVLAAGAARAGGDGAGAGATVVDLCSGSGAIALAVAVEVPASRVVAVEREPHARAWAERNIARLAPGRVELLAGDVTADPSADGGPLAAHRASVDVVVANPPYIPDGSRPVDPEVAGHDPAAALYGGGPDGLAVPRAVVVLAARLLRPGGVLVMEHGDAQGRACRALAAPPVWTGARTRADLTGRDRAVVARLAGG
ncbi:MAG: release factor glutamine methyltransferase [Actinomycetota bacterium]|nr:release factor glutamine methyltransferase [Actinomycetota bacterium]